MRSRPRTTTRSTWSQFVPNEQVDPILLGSSYFLEPVGRSSKAYVLLRRTLEETERTAVVTFTLRTKTRLGVLRIHGDLLALQTLRWPKDLKEVDFGPSKSKISAKELKMSASLVEQFSGDFEPEQFTDEYQAQLRELLDAKLEQGESVDTEATFGKESSEEDSAEGGKVISLMDALERSVRKRRGAQESEEPEESKGSDSKSSSTKSTSTKKTGTQKAKKTGTKKTEPKKTESGKSGAKKTASKKDGTKKTGWQELGREEVRLSTRDQHMGSSEAPREGGHAATPHPVRGMRHDVRHHRLPPFPLVPSASRGRDVSHRGFDRRTQLRWIRLSCSTSRPGWRGRRGRAASAGC